MTSRSPDDFPYPYARLPAFLPKPPPERGIAARIANIALGFVVAFGAVSLILLIGAMLFIGFSLMLMRPSLSHEWYPIECCSGKDCSNIAATRVSIVDGGYLIDNRYYVPQAQVRRAPDQDYHACFPQPEKLLCFFAPPGAV